MTPDTIEIIRRAHVRITNLDYWTTGALGRDDSDRDLFEIEDISLVSTDRWISWCSEAALRTEAHIASTQGISPDLRSAAQALAHTARTLLPQITTLNHWEAIVTLNDHDIDPHTHEIESAAVRHYRVLRMFDRTLEAAA